MFCIICSLASYSQKVSQLTIEECYTKAEQNYPLVQQYGILDKIEELTLDNISKGKYPSFSIFGQASYQSSTTAIPIDIPGIDMSDINRDQYKLYGEATKSLTDRKNRKKQNEIYRAKTEITKRELDVSIYLIKERVNQLYFGILLIDQQLNLTELLKKDIEIGINKSHLC